MPASPLHCAREAMPVGFRWRCGGPTRRPSASAVRWNSRARIMAEPARTLSVVVPAYNEEAVIAPPLRALIAHLDREQIDYEILVVTDASRDGTEAVLFELETTSRHLRHVTNPGPHGYGCAVRHGLGHFKGDAVVVMMAD